MKIYELKSNKWNLLRELDFEDTLKHWIFLYNDDLEIMGIGIY